MIKILITGDFCPHKRVEQLSINKRFIDIYNNFYPILEDNDINITNLECPLINEASPITKVGPNLSAEESCIETLKYGKFNLLTLSNNHIMDHGEKGLFSTVQLCKNNSIDIVGAGKNLKEASQVYHKKILDYKIAFLNFSEIEFSSAEINQAGSNPLNPVKNYYSIKSARRKADFVIVIIHGGHEGYVLPSPRMVETYRFFIDAGADIIVGHHTHCFSGYEQYNNGLIFYSLGNFIFDLDNAKISDWNYGFAVKFMLEKEQISFEIIPYKQCEESPGVFLLTESETQIFNEKLKILNNKILDSDLLLKEWKALAEQRKAQYLIKFEVYSSKILAILRYRKLIPTFLSKKKKAILLNTLRCESHRDIAIESLKP